MRLRRMHMGYKPALPLAAREFVAVLSAACYWALMS